MSKSLAITTGSILAIVLAFGATTFATDQTQDQTQNQTQTQEQDRTCSEDCQQNRAERQKEHLENAVKNGTITQSEADEIQKWWDARPAAMEKLKGEGRGMRNRSGLKNGNCQSSTNSNAT